MKKITSIMLTLTFVLTLLPTVMSVSADGKQITKEEAQTLITLAFEVYEDFTYGPSRDTNAYFVFDENDYKIYDFGGDWGKSGFVRIKSYVFYEKTFDIDTRDKFVSFIKSLYSDSALSVMKKQYADDVAWVNVDAFKEEDGKIYFGGLPIVRYWGNYSPKVDSVSVKGSKAIVNVIMTNKLPEEPETYYRIPIELLKTDNGWIINSDIENLHSKDERYLINNPSTGDNTAPLVLAAFASLLPLAWFGLRRKRVF